MAELVVGNPDSEFVRAGFGVRPYPEGRTTYERNLVAVRLEIVTLPFSGSFDATWLVESIPCFRGELVQLYDSLEGVAHFSPDYEGSLVLDLAGDGLGHVSVAGTCCADAAAGPWLRFNLATIDQTYLPALIGDLEALEHLYPAV